MPAIAEPTQDLDFTVLEDIFNADSPKCDIHECENDATHVITCKCGKGTEYICSKCLQATIVAIRLRITDGKFTFDKSCGHRTHLAECAVRPV